MKLISHLIGARATAPLSQIPHSILGCTLLLLTSLFGCSPPTDNPPAAEWRQLALSGETMGTSYHVKLVVKGEENPEVASLKERIDSDLVAFNKLLSTYDPESELSHFNLHSSTEAFTVSPETIDIVQTSFELYRETEGAFDPTVSPLIDLWGFGSQGPHLSPPEQGSIERALGLIGMNRLEVSGHSLIKKVPQLQLNLSAIAKGYGVDVIARALLDEGYTDLMVEIGGEVVVRGKNLKRRAWTIGIDSPDQQPGRRELIETLSLNDCAVATSGDYRNAFEYEGKHYSHIIDPKTGWPIPESVKSVTVVAPTCMLADGAATAIMAMGAEKGLAWAEGREDLEALVFVQDDKAEIERLETTGMKRFFSQTQSTSPSATTVGGQR